MAQKHDPKLGNITKIDEKKMAGRTNNALESFCGFYVDTIECKREYNLWFNSNYTLNFSNVVFIYESDFPLQPTRKHYRSLKGIKDN
ncbi:hypothetical protein HZS_5494 [Henneguya salminicola]|nr:hypothetical protein HZS_5494 [Henneguya salminicola]